MYEILNEAKRIEAILSDGLMTHWKSDVKLLTKEYKKQGKSKKEITELIYSMLCECENFNRFDKDEISSVKSCISQGIKEYNNNANPTIIDSININVAILNYINKHCVSRNEKKLAFTLYVWYKLFNTRVIIFENNKKSFCSFLGIDSGNINKTLSKDINHLIKIGLIYENIEMKRKSKDGKRRYIVNFEVASNNNNIVKVNRENDTYLSYAKRIYESPNYNERYDNKNMLIHYDYTNLVEYDRGKLYLYPEEFEYLDTLDSSSNHVFISIPKEDEYITLEGPENYNTELCNDGKYLDDLHNPGNYIDRYFNGEATCKCGAKITAIQYNKVNGVYKCRTCRHKDSKLKNIENNYKEYEAFKINIKEEFTRKCIYCGEEFVVAADDPHWTEYKTGSRECPKCEKRHLDNNTKLKKTDEKMICEYCGKPYTLKKNRKDYWDVIKGESRSLCEVDRKRFTDRCRKMGYIYEEYVEKRLDEKYGNTPVEIKAEDINIDITPIKEVTKEELINMIKK